MVVVVAKLITWFTILPCRLFNKRRLDRDKLLFRRNKLAVPRWLLCGYRYRKKWYSCGLSSSITCLWDVMHTWPCKGGPQRSPDQPQMYHILSYIVTVLLETSCSHCANTRPHSSRERSVTQLHPLPLSRRSALPMYHLCSDSHPTPKRPATTPKRKSAAPMVLPVIPRRLMTIGAVSPLQREREAAMVMLRRRPQRRMREEWKRYRARLRRLQHGES